MQGLTLFVVTTVSSQYKGLGSSCVLQHSTCETLFFSAPVVL
jgi:hypothetical protein